MTTARTLQISALFAVLAAPPLAASEAPPAQGAAAKREQAARQARTSPEQAGSGKPDAATEVGRTPLRTLPLFELPEQASDSAREHVSLAHARRDAHRARHTRAAAQHGKSTTGRRACQKPVQQRLSAARGRRAADQARRDAAEERRTFASERRAAAEERRAAASQQRDAAAALRANAAELPGAAQERGSSARRR